ncbi:MAG: hypothetical protein PWP14_1864 [Methanolobus sp.]|nr:hypothetical protein [Methanolobus sp.]
MSWHLTNNKGFYVCRLHPSCISQNFSDLLPDLVSASAGHKNDYKYNDYKNNHYMRFYNREKELALMFLLDRNKPSFLVITGKRRIGKTELIRQ